MYSQPRYADVASVASGVLLLHAETCVAQPLVSGDSMVPDVRLTASGSWDANHGPYRARLHMIKEGDYRGGWIADYPWNDNQWIQVTTQLSLQLDENLATART